MCSTDAVHVVVQHHISTIIDLIHGGGIGNASHEPIGLDAAIRVTVHSDLLERLVSYTEKNRFVMSYVDMKASMTSFSVHIKITNFLVEMRNFHVILTEECGDTPLITLCRSSRSHS